VKAIVIFLDTLRRDHLGAYGNPWIRTPKLDEFARESAVFEDFRTASFPTVPCRRDLVTGRFSFPWRGWEPLTDAHPTLPKVLGERGVTTMLLLDTPHLVREGFGFDRHFQGFWLLRGQEDDSFNTDPVTAELPAPRKKLRDSPPGIYDQYLRNIKLRRPALERDYFPPKLFSAAEEWLERNRGHQDFFLWLDSFNPHEPWDTPHPYCEMYDPGYKGNRLTYPRQGRADYQTPRERKNMRALYAGMVSFVDKWVGRFLDKVKELGLWEETLVILTSDHGIYLGEHNAQGKIGGTLYDEAVRVPFIMHHPKNLKSGRRIRGFAQHPDIMPTVLDHFGIGVPQSVHGESLLPRLRGRKAAAGAAGARSFALSAQAGNPLTWTDSRWTYVRWPRDPGKRKLLSGSKQGCAGLLRDELYDLKKDPGQKKNVLNKHGDVARRLDGRLKRFLEEREAPEKFIRTYWPE